MSKKYAIIAKFPKKLEIKSLKDFEDLEISRGDTGYIDSARNLSQLGTCFRCERGRGMSFGDYETATDTAGKVFREFGGTAVIYRAVSFRMKLARFVRS